VPEAVIARAEKSCSERQHAGSGCYKTLIQTPIVYFHTNTLLEAAILWQEWSSYAL